MANTIIKWYETNNASATYTAATGGAQILAANQYTFLYQVSCGTTPSVADAPAFTAPALYGAVPMVPTTDIAGPFGAATLLPNAAVTGGANPAIGPGPILPMMDMTHVSVNPTTLYTLGLKATAPDPINTNGYGFVHTGLTCAAGKVPVIRVFKVCGNGTSTINQLLQTVPGVNNS